MPTGRTTLAPVRRTPKDCDERRPGWKGFHVRTRETSFLSDGTRCAGRLYLASASVAHAQGLPCVVMSHGASGTMSLGLDAYASRFADAGFAVFAFDYRHFGLSDGEPRQLISVGEQLEDLRSAVRFARNLPEVAADRVAIWGTSLSGGHVVAVGAADPTLAAVVAQVPWMGVDLRRADPRPVSATARLLLAALRDAVDARAGRPPVLLPVFGPAHAVTILGEPDDRAALDALVAAGPDWRNELAARSVLSLLLYRPGRRSRRLKMPLLVCIAESDVLTSVRLAARAAATAPRGELRRYASGHFDAYVGQAFEAMVADQIAFLGHHLEEAGDG